MYEEDKDAQKSSSPYVDMIRGLAPLASHLKAFGLARWQVTSEVVEAIAASLPGVLSLKLQRCTLDAGAWREMLTLTEVSKLFLESTPFSLLQLTTFATGLRHELSLCLKHNCMEATDEKAFLEYLPTLHAQRESMGLPPFNFRFFPRIMRPKGTEGKK